MLALKLIAFVSTFLHRNNPVGILIRLQCWEMEQNTTMLFKKRPNPKVKYEYKLLLRSTKWNASLILICGFQELGSLRKIICWKIHIPVRTPKWLPRLIICRGMSRPVNWYRDYVIKACDTFDKTCEQVSRQGELWSFLPCALDLNVSVGFYTASFSTDFKQYLTG